MLRRFRPGFPQFHLPVVDSAVVNESLPFDEKGDLRWETDLGCFYQLMVRVSQRGKGALERLEVRPDNLGRFVPIGEHQPENNPVRSEFIGQPTVLGHVAVRNGTLPADKNKYDSL